MGKVDQVEVGLDLGALGIPIGLKGSLSFSDTDSPISRLIADGDPAGARSMYERAIASGDPHQAAQAAKDYGNALATLGDLASARVAYERAIDTRDRALAPQAAHNLGMTYLIEIRRHAPTTAARRVAYLIRQQPRLLRAREAFRRALVSEEPEVVSHATLGLGVSFMMGGRNLQARETFETVVASPESRASAVAYVLLGAMLKRRGDSAAAERALSQAVAVGKRRMDPSDYANFQSTVAKIEQR